MDESNREFNINFMPLGKNFRPLLAGLMPLLLIAVILFMIFAAQNEYRQGRYIGQDVERKNSITISGEGKVQAKPDIAMVSLSVLSEATTVAAAQKDNTEKMNKIIKAMKDTGIDEKDLKTTNYSINPKYQYISGKSIIIGYEVNQTLEVKIRNLDKISSVLSSGAELGANQIGGLTFTFDDSEGLKAEARKKAIENARQKAKILADDLDVDLVRIISFSESTNEPPIPFYAERAFGIGGGGETPSIEAGQNEIAASVAITYEIQ